VKVIQSIESDGTHIEAVIGKNPAAATQRVGERNLVIVQVDWTPRELRCEKSEGRREARWRCRLHVAAGVIRALSSSNGHVLFMRLFLPTSIAINSTQVLFNNCVTLLVCQVLGCMLFWPSRLTSPDFDSTSIDLPEFSDSDYDLYLQNEERAREFVKRD